MATRSLLGAVLALGLLAAAGCSDEPGRVADPDVVAATDIVVEPDQPLDIGLDLQTLDLAGEDSAQTCPGGAFCACSTDASCTSGFCLETAAGKQCAPLCNEGCPADWRCISIGGDSGSYCAPQGVRDCSPCQTNNDCNVEHGVSSSCVSLGSAGSFCATTCSVSNDCPAGSVCSLTPDATMKVCQPKDGLGSCGCSAWAVANGSSTSCLILQGNEVCPGTKQCGVAGLGSCEPVANEICYDAACKGVADGVACDDGDACTASTQCSQGECKGGTPSCECQSDAECGKLEDDNLCNGTLYCDLSAHKCVVNPVTVVQCPASANACSPQVCDPELGTCSAIQLPDNTPCDDNKACTIGDVCVSGACVSGTVTCTCAVDADCAAHEDGNLCNGTLFCNKAKGQCQVNPATIVSCQTGLDTTCVQNVCEPLTGSCKQQFASNSKLCDDGNPCSGADHCEQGECVSTANLCTCESDADCVASEDGNLCNGTLYCNLDTHACAINPATVVHCPDPIPGTCTPFQCQPESGECVVSPLLSGQCSDGDPCTGGDHCVSGSCVGSVGLCQCQTADDCKPFNDGNACNGELYCDTVNNQCKVNPTTVVSCGAGGGGCESSACDVQSGTCKTVPAPDGQQCQDGEPCTKNDLCQQGQCQAGKSICACYTDAHCESEDDGNRCNGVWFCDKSDGSPDCAFDPQSVVTCDQTGVGTCEAMICVPLSGACTNVVADGEPCDDGDVCTQNDLCSGTSCVPGGPVSCDDGDTCTLDACDPAMGCAHAMAEDCAALPYQTGFDCDVPNSWQFDANAAGPVWAVDSAPTMNLSGAAACTLNFNNGANYECASGANAILEQFATSPWLDALPNGVDGPLGLQFRYAGEWEANPSYERLRVQIRPYGGSWSDVAVVKPDYTTQPALRGWHWLNLTLQPEQTGARFQLRFGFQTADCGYNATSGPYIDNLRVTTIGCVTAADCANGGTCTQAMCSDGTCVWTAAPADTLCTHDNACASGGTCAAGGVCHSKTPLTCDDGSECTADNCQADEGCSHAALSDTVPCEGVTIGGRCHVLVNLLSTGGAPNWQVAKDSCANWGGTIGPLRSWQEAKTLRDALATDAQSDLLNKNYWLGLTDEKQDGILRWPDGTRPQFDQFIEISFSNTVSQLDCVHWRPWYPGAVGDWVQAPCDSGSADYAICSKPVARPCDDSQACTIDDRCESGSCVGASAVSNTIPDLFDQPRFVGSAVSGHGSMHVGIVGYATGAIAYALDPAGRPLKPLGQSTYAYGVESRLRRVAADRTGYAAVGMSRGDKDPKVEQGLFVHYGFDGTQSGPPSTFGGAGVDELNAVVPSGDDHLLVGTAGAPSFGVTGEAGWVVRRAADGTEQWSKTFGSTNAFYRRLIDAVPTSDGGLIAVGTEDSVGWILRISASGTVVWSHGLNTGGAPMLGYKGIAVTENGVVAVGADLNDWSVVVQAVDWNGNQQWISRISDGTGGTEATSIAAYDGQILVGASTSGFGAETVQDGLLAKLTGSGELQWIRRMPKAPTADGQTFIETILAVSFDPLYGRLMAVGQDNAGLIVGRPWMLQLDAFGNDTCSGEATCLTANVGMCSDALQCTMAWCDAATSQCVSETAPDAVLCGGNLSCVAGSCQ